MSRTSIICVALLLCCAITGSSAVESAKCKKAKKGKLAVPDSTEILVLHGKGIRTFWCNGGEFEYTGRGTLHGDQVGTVVSADGQWSGKQAFRVEDGVPIWDLVNKATKETLVIVATNVPEARMKAPNGDPMTWDRRQVIEYEGPITKPNWVIRTNTTSDPLPTKCTGDNDANVPYTATYRFYTCEKIKSSPSPKPSKSPSPKPAKAPSPKPAKAPSPASAKAPKPSM